MTMRIAVLTNAGAYGMRVLLALNARGVRPEVIVLPTTMALRDCLEGATPVARILRSPLAPARCLRRRARFALEQRPALSSYGLRVEGTGALNSRAMVRLLRRVEPDLLVLAGVGIVSPHVIESARRGVLNAHPALLPWARGNGVVGHSLEQGVPLGATCHYVDRTIDTGPLIERRLLPIGEDEACNLRELSERADQLRADILAEVVARAIETGQIPEATAQTQRFPLYRWPCDKPQWLAHHKLARSARPRELFEAWAPLCQTRDQWRLPTEFQPPTPLDAS